MSFSRSSTAPSRIGLVLLLISLGIVPIGCSDQTAGVKPENSIKSDPGASPPQSPSTTNPTGSPVATIRGLPVSQNELDSLLYDSYGLTLLFDLAELNMAKELLANSGLQLTPADIDAERDLLLEKLCGPDRSAWDNLFSQFLQQKKMTRAEFEIKIVQTRACLRKVITPQVRDRMPERLIRSWFDQNYGAKRRIQDIELPNLDAVARARQRLNEVPFGQVAAELSLDPLTRGNGGRWEPFAHDYQPVPEVIRVQAFGLEVGQISEPLQVGSHFHLIKVIETIDPKVYKYDAETHAVVKQSLENEMIEREIVQKQQMLGRSVQQEIRITNPILAKKWEAVSSGSRPSTMDRDEVSERIGRSRSTTGPTTAPTTLPTFDPMAGPMAPTTQPAGK